MNRREKMLVGTVAALLTLLGAVRFARSWVIAPLSDLRSSLDEARQRRERLELDLAASDKVARSWQSQTQRTLAGNAFQAEQMFREDVTDLLERSGLVEELSVSPARQVREKKGFREGFIELDLPVRAKGSLDAVVSFMKAFYQRPYLARISRFTILAETPAGGAAAAQPARAGRHSEAEARLTVAMVLTTLVLPSVTGVKHVTIPRPMDSVYPGLLRESEPSEYDVVVATNIFKRYVPPPPPPPPPREPPTETPVARVERPPPDPRANADKMVLVGSMSLDGDHVALVQDRGKLTEPPLEIRPNESIDDGSLVLVHPMGVVVRVDLAAEQPGSSREYFYALGSSFKQRVPIEQADPQIARELRLAQRQ